MEVDPNETEFKSNMEGHTYYFCSAKCKSRFDAHPQAYIQNNAEAKQTA